MLDAELKGAIIMYFPSLDVLLWVAHDSLSGTQFPRCKIKGLTLTQQGRRTGSLSRACGSVSRRYRELPEASVTQRGLCPGDSKSKGIYPPARLQQWAHPQSSSVAISLAVCPRAGQPSSCPEPSLPS